MKSITVLLAFLVFSYLIFSTISHAEWSFLGDHNKLKGYIITESGDVALYNPQTFSKKLNNQDIYYFNSGNELSFCFKIDTDTKMDVDNEAVLLLIDMNKNLKLAFFKTLVDKIDVYLVDFSKTDCR